MTEKTETQKPTPAVTPAQETLRRNIMGRLKEEAKKPEGTPPGPGTPGPKSPGPKSPGPKSPDFKLPNFDDLFNFTKKVSRSLAKLIVKSALALTVLTGFAKKETQQSVDNEPPKATLTVGTLGMRLMKASINNGDKSTDFDANMVLAQGAKEVVGKVFPEKEQDKFFAEKPIEKGAFGDKAKEALSKVPSKEAKEMSVADMAKVSGKIPGR